jgi:hypothetical protein
VFENRLDIDDRSAVDCLQALHLKPAVRIYAQNLCTVQSYRIGPVWRTSGKHTHQSVQHNASRVDLENRAPRFMEPRENPDILSGLDAVEAPGKLRMDFQPCIGRALPTLTRSAGAILQRGMYIADRRNIEALRDIHDGAQEWIEANFILDPRC